MTDLSRKLLGVVAGGAAIVALATTLKPATSESEPVVASYRPISADKDGGCSSEHWPNFSQACLRSRDTAPARTVTETTLNDLGPTNPEVIVLPSKTQPALTAMDALARWETNNLEKPRRAPRPRAPEAHSSGNAAAAMSPILYGR